MTETSSGDDAKAALAGRAATVSQAAQGLRRESGERHLPKQRTAVGDERGAAPRWPVPADDTTPVVFISAVGADGASWQPVIDRLTCGAPAISYDRPGIGSCPPRTGPNPAIPYSVFADELLALLKAKGIDGPTVLVGHSVGSLIARVYAGRYPDRVAGVVHVDGSIPRLHLLVAGEPFFDGDGPGATELDTIAGEVEVLRAAVPRAPAVVVSREPGRHPELPHPTDELWTVYQEQLAAEWGAPHIIADGSDHQVPRDRPDVIAAAVDAVVIAARNDAAVRLRQW
ncbi:alpha/beta fold hydrolase [Catenuloplanes sp. NPDC051500]|uniref:alpha/beta fold hydrolase n=1 Tax=Catenuloplanes sp. NPDC051500 TaxID=3363959 RepID=UPI00378BFC37